VRQHERLGAAVRAGGEQFRGAATVGPGGFNTRDRRTKPPTAWNKKWIEPRNAGLYHTHTPHWSSGRSSRGLMTENRPALVSVGGSRIHVCTKLLTVSDFCKAGPVENTRPSPLVGRPWRGRAALVPCGAALPRAFDPTSGRAPRPAPDHGAGFPAITVPSSPPIHGSTAGVPRTSRWTGDVSAHARPPKKRARTVERRLPSYRSAVRANGSHLRPAFGSARPSPRAFKMKLKTRPPV
jgi:hypothetical protein